MRTLGTAAVLAATVTVALTGCGTVIDTEKAEKFINATVTDQVGAHVKTVDCPDGKKAKKGETFTCTVTGADGSKGDVIVTERDDKGNVNVSAPFVHPREIEASIASGLGKRVKTKVRIGCPEIIVAKAKASFNCTAIDSKGQTARVEAVQTDAKGHVRYRVTQ